MHTYLPLLVENNNDTDFEEIAIEAAAIAHRLGIRVGLTLTDELTVILEPAETAEGAACMAIEAGADMRRIYEEECARRERLNMTIMTIMGTGGEA